jgi:4-hydroxythreonine-4-phosphate dehydrogenase
MLMDKPIIAITMGDAAGIGPELIIKILNEPAVYDQCQPFVVGDPKVMRDACEIVGAKLEVKVVESISEGHFAPSILNVLMPADLRIDHVRRGRVDPSMGSAAALCLQKAYELALVGQVHGVVSAPLNKEAFHLAGYDFLDELAFLADLTESQDTFILGVMGSVWTVAVTEHVPFNDILGLVKRDRIVTYVQRLHAALRQVGLSNPKIAVAALNVHAGEGGLFGREEIDEIAPAVEEARGRGIAAQGPVPADMVFVLALDGMFDGVVSMYHDQANIARKLQPKSEGATLFMGLPVICGTTAHGTAFDIAGKGIADPGSLYAALRYTIRLAA